MKIIKNQGYGEILTKNRKLFFGETLL